MNTIIDRALIRNSKDIFDKLDKWNAFNELRGLSEEIIKHWFEIGTKQLRKYFNENPAKGWRCEAWWNHEYDTRWYIEKLGSRSVAIAFGDYKLILLKSEMQRLNSSNWCGKQLEEKKCKYAKLLEPFGMNPVFTDRNSWVLEDKCSFTFGGLSGGNIDRTELAWYASHQIDNFVTQATKKIEQFIGDPEITRLVAELNTEA